MLERQRTHHAQAVHERRKRIKHDTETARRKCLEVPLKGVQELHVVPCLDVRLGQLAELHHAAGGELSCTAAMIDVAPSRVTHLHPKELSRRLAGEFQRV